MEEYVTLEILFQYYLFLVLFFFSEFAMLTYPATYLPHIHIPPNAVRRPTSTVLLFLVSEYDTAVRKPISSRYASGMFQKYLRSDGKTFNVSRKKNPINVIYLLSFIIS